MNEFVYVASNKGFKELKIGSTKDVNKRLSELSSSSPYDFELVASFEVPHGLYFEKRIHEALSDRRVNREFFSLSKKEVKSIIAPMIDKIMNDYVAGRHKHIREIPTAEDLVKALRERRKYAGMNQKELGTFTNMSMNGISKFESGNSDPSLKSVFSICKFLGITILFAYDE